MTSPRALGGDAVTSLGKAVNSGGGRACADTGPGALRLRPAPRRRAKGVRLLSTVFRLEGRTLQNGEPRGTCAERGARAQSARSAPGRGAGGGLAVRRGACAGGCRVGDPPPSHWGAAHAAAVVFQVTRGLLILFAFCSKRNCTSLYVRRWPFKAKTQILLNS